MPFNNLDRWTIYLSIWCFIKLKEKLKNISIAFSMQWHFCYIMQRWLCIMFSKLSSRVLYFLLREMNTNWDNIRLTDNNVSFMNLFRELKMCIIKLFPLYKSSPYWWQRKILCLCLWCYMWIYCSYFLNTCL